MRSVVLIGLFLVGTLLVTDCFPREEDENWVGKHKSKTTQRPHSTRTTRTSRPTTEAPIEPIGDVNDYLNMFKRDAGDKAPPQNNGNNKPKVCQEWSPCYFWAVSGCTDHAEEKFKRNGNAEKKAEYISACIPRFMNMCKQQQNNGSAVSNPRVWSKNLGSELYSSLLEMLKDRITEMIFSGKYKRDLSIEMLNPGNLVNQLESIKETLDEVLEKSRDDHNLTSEDIENLELINKMVTSVNTVVKEYVDYGTDTVNNITDAITAKFTDQLSGVIDMITKLTTGFRMKRQAGEQNQSDKPHGVSGIINQALSKPINDALESLQNTLNGMISSGKVRRDIPEGDRANLALVGEGVGAVASGLTSSMYAVDSMTGGLSNAAGIISSLAGSGIIKRDINQINLKPLQDQLNEVIELTNSLLNIADRALEGMKQGQLIELTEEDKQNLDKLSAALDSLYDEMIKATGDAGKAFQDGVTNIEKIMAEISATITKKIAALSAAMSSKVKRAIKNPSELIGTMSQAADVAKAMAVTTSGAVLHLVKRELSDQFGDDFDISEKLLGTVLSGVNHGVHGLTSVVDGVSTGVTGGLNTVVGGLSAGLVKRALGDNQSDFIANAINQMISTALSNVGNAISEKLTQNQPQKRDIHNGEITPEDAATANNMMDSAKRSGQDPSDESTPQGAFDGLQAKLYPDILTCMQNNNMNQIKKCNARAVEKQCPTQDS